jgi:hypothetical protein
MKTPVSAVFWLETSSTLQVRCSIVTAFEHMIMLQS